MTVLTIPVYLRKPCGPASLKRKDDQVIVTAFLFAAITNLCGLGEGEILRQIDRHRLASLKPSYVQHQGFAVANFENLENLRRVKQPPRGRDIAVRNNHRNQGMDEFLQTDCALPTRQLVSHQATTKRKLQFFLRSQEVADAGASSPRSNHFFEIISDTVVDILETVEGLDIEENAIGNAAAYIFNFGCDVNPEAAATVHFLKPKRGIQYCAEHEPRSLALAGYSICFIGMAGSVTCVIGGRYSRSEGEQTNYSADRTNANLVPSSLRGIRSGFSRLALGIKIAGFTALVLCAWLCATAGFIKALNSRVNFFQAVGYFLLGGLLFVLAWMFWWLAEPHYYDAAYDHEDGPPVHQKHLISPLQPPDNLTPNQFRLNPAGAIAIEGSK